MFSVNARDHRPESKVQTRDRCTVIFIKSKSQHTDYHSPVYVTLFPQNLQFFENSKLSLTVSTACETTQHVFAINQ